MLPKDFLNDVEITQKDTIALHENLLKDFKNDPTSVKYDYKDDRLWDYKDERFYLNDDSDPRTMAADMNEFLDSTEKYKDYPQYSCVYDVDADSSDDCGYISRNEIIVRWREPNAIFKDKTYEQFAKRDAKTRVESALKPESYKYNARQIDCKFMTLWVEEKIEWDTLQQIVYSDCSL